MKPQRQVLTILFCDLLESTAFTEQLTLEDFMELMQAYHHCVYQSITIRYGWVAQHLGDGVMAYFGYPTAFNHAPRKAIETALALLDDISTVSTPALHEHGLDLKIRISIHTGTVVMADLGMGKRKETLAMGVTPNIAARLQSVAPDSGIAVSQATYEETKDHFIFKPLGSYQLKGVTDKMQVFQPLGLRS